MKKRIISIMMIAAMLFGFASCKVDEDMREKVKETKKDDKANSIVNQDLSPEDSAAMEEWLKENNIDPDNMENFDPEQLQDKLNSTEPVPELEFGGSPIDDSASNKVEVDLDETGNPEHIGEKVDFIELIESEKFTLDMVMKSDTDGESIAVPVKVYRDGKNMYMEMKAPTGEGTSMDMIMLVKDGKYYYIIPAMRGYMEVPVEMTEEMFPTDMFNEEDALKGDYIESREVNVDGKKLICHIYNKDGAVSKYYYDGEDLKRIESEKDGSTTIIQINEMKKTVDSSKIQKPKGYINLELLMGSGNFDLSGLQ